MRCYTLPARSLRPAADFVRQNLLFLSLALLLLAGLLTGCLLVRFGYAPSLGLAALFPRFLAARCGRPIFILFFHAAVASILYLLCAYFCGLFVFGAPIAAALPFLKGLGLGAVCGYAYAAYGLSGAALCLLVILPPAFVQSMALAAAARTALLFSSRLFAPFAAGAPFANPPGAFRRYHLQFLLLLAITLAAALFDSCLSRLFLGLFDL